MEGACPGIEAAITQAGLDPLLPKYQRAALTRDGLINLRSLLKRYEQPPERGELDTQAVQSVLQSLREPAQAARSQSWYERFKRWLHQAFNKQQDRANPWLQRWLDEHSMSEAVRLALFYGVVGLVILLALLIVLNEVRTARAGRYKAVVEGDGSRVPGLFSPELLDGVSRGEQASALLRMLIATLLKTGRLHGAQSLTHRELMSRARFDDSNQSESFRRVAQLAEHEVFAARQPTDAELDDAVQAGRHLHAQLTGAAR
jgi:hypothetical protein